MERSHSSDIIRHSKTLRGEQVALHLEDSTYTQHLLNSGQVTDLFLEFVPRSHQQNLLPPNVEKFSICIDQTDAVDFNILEASIILKPNLLSDSKLWEEKTIDYIRHAMYGEVDEIYEPYLSGSNSQCYLQLDDQTSLCVETSTDRFEWRIDITRTDTIAALADANVEFDLDDDIAIKSNYQLFLGLLTTLSASFDSLDPAEGEQATVFSVNLDKHGASIKLFEHLAEVIPINDMAARAILKQRQASADQNS